MNLKNRWLLNEEGDPNGGEFSGGGGSGEGEGQQQTAQQGNFDYQKFADTLSQTIAERIPAKQESNELSDEDFRKMTNYYGVSKQDVEELFGSAPEGADQEEWYGKKMAALQRMLDGGAKHAIAIGTMKSQYDMRELNKRFAPIVEDISKKQFESYVDGVISKNETLKSMGDNGKELVKTAIGALQAQGYKPKAGEDESVAIGEMCKKLVELAGGQFQQRQQSGGGRASGMAGGVNGAGGSGAAGGVKGKAAKEPWQRLPF